MNINKHLAIHCNLICLYWFYVRYHVFKVPFVWIQLSHLSVSVLGVHASNFQKRVAIKLYISELKCNLEVFTVQMLVED